MFINDISYEGGAVSIVDSEEKNNNFNKMK